jgi:radical SAM enzyme (rSAM/lipoprotein system)
MTASEKAAQIIHSFYRNSETILSDLNYLFWECTLRCNLSCLHCGSDCQNSSRTEDMPLSVFVRALDSVVREREPRKVMLVLTGGEPLLRSDLAECGQEFYRRRFPWGMVTNGFALTQQRLAMLLDSGLRSLTMSLDGLEGSHNYLRNHPDSFKKADRALSIIGEIPQEVCYFDAVTCVHQKNTGELEAMKDYLLSKKIRNWRLTTIFPRGRAVENEGLDISGGQLQNLLEFIARTREQGKINVSFSCEGFLGEYEGRVRSGRFFCRAGVNIGSVLADGSISACPSLRGDYIQGNIYREDFMEVWNSRFQVMRDRRHLKTGRCAKCSSWNSCQGNGLHLREEKTGRLLRCHLGMLEGE